jgi:hypothetical protein
MKAGRLVEARSNGLLKEDEAESIGKAIDRHHGFFKQTLHRSKILSLAACRCAMPERSKELCRAENTFLQRLIANVTLS